MEALFNGIPLVFEPVIFGEAKSTDRSVIRSWADRRTHRRNFGKTISRKPFFHLKSPIKWGKQVQSRLLAVTPLLRACNFRRGEVDRFYSLAPFGATQLEEHDCCEFHQKRNISAGGSAFFVLTPSSAKQNRLIRVRHFTGSLSLLRTRHFW